MLVLQEQLSFIQAELQLWSRDINLSWPGRQRGSSEPRDSKGNSLSYLFVWQQLAAFPNTPKTSCWFPRSGCRNIQRRKEARRSTRWQQISILCAGQVRSYAKLEATEPVRQISPDEFLSISHRILASHVPTEQLQGSSDSFLQQCVSANPTLR
jgi:hypothetical protein